MARIVSDDKTDAGFHRKDEVAELRQCGECVLDLTLEFPHLCTAVVRNHDDKFIAAIAHRDESLRDSVGNR